MDSVADGGLGDVRGDGRGAGAGRPQRRSPQPRRGLRLRRHRLRCAAELLAHGDLRRRPLARALPDAGGARDSLRRGPRRRQRRLRPARRPGDGADAGPLPPALPVAHARPRPTAILAILLLPGLLPRIGQGGRHRRGGELARSGPELRRRLRLLDLVRLERRPHRLGDARPRGGRAQPFRRDQRGGKSPIDFLRGHLDEVGQSRRPRSHDRRPRGRRRRPALFRGAIWSALCSGAAPRTAPTSAGRGPPPSA